MRVKRTSLTSGDKAQVFHVVSRIVGRQLIFEDEEKEFFHFNMRKMESYSGLEILSYCLMGNHFHLLLHIPAKPGELSFEDVRKRMGHKYSKKKMAEFEALFVQMRKSGTMDYESEFYKKQWARMFDLPNFLKELKERFTKYYNKKEERSGTLWESRYSSSLVEAKPDSMMRLGAYIEHNPVRAGIVDTPEKYKWCSYAEAKAGGKKAIEGILKIVTGFENNLTSEKAIENYSNNFYRTGTKSDDLPRSLSSQQSGYDESQAEGDITKARVRFYTDGLAIGSREFLEDFMKSHNDIVPATRKSRGTEIKGTRMFSYRNVR